MATPTKPATTPPYTTYKAFKTMIEGFRENGLPSHLTKSVMPGSPSGKPTMSASIKYLGLITSDEVPTEKLTQLIESEDKYPDVLKTIVLESYPFLKNKSIDLDSTTTDKLVEKFDELGAGGSTISKCMAFFLAACKDSGISVSKYVKAPAPPSNKSSKKRAGGVDTPPPTPPPPPAKENLDGYTPFEIPIPGAKPVKLLLPDGLNDGQWTMFKAVLDAYLQEFQKLNAASQIDSSDSESIEGMKKNLLQSE